MGHRLGVNKGPDRVLTREELRAFLFAVKYGNTVPQATAVLELDHGKVQRTLDDIEIRSFVIDLSMVARAMSEWDSKYFTRAEFKCPCCNFDTVDYELINVLEYIREHFDKPVIVDSGCRCVPYNDSVDGSAPYSQHILGRAADIRIAGIDPDLVYELAEQMEVGGLGSYDTFTHIDTRSGPLARW